MKIKGREQWFMWTRGQGSLNYKKLPAMCRVRGGFQGRRKNMCKGCNMFQVFEEMKEILYGQRSDSKGG